MDNNVRFDPPAAEMWRPVPGATRYEVSNLGRLRSLVNVDRETGEPYQMTWCLSAGYPSTRIRFDDGIKRTVFAHRLVAAAFLGPRPPGHQVLHRDDVRADCRLSNLYYGTPLDNGADAKRNGSHLPRDPEKCGRPGKLGAATVRSIRNRVNDGETVAEIADALGLAYGVVYHVAHGKTYARVKQTTAEQERARLELHAKREQARLARDTRRAFASIEALERVAPPEGQRRRRAPHTPAARAPMSASRRAA